MMSSAGTSVFTETCGHVRVAKFKSTVCVYWICGKRTVISSKSKSDVTEKVGTSWPGMLGLALSAKGGPPNMH